MEKVTQTVKRYYVSLPTQEAHHKTHMTSGMHGMAQWIHPKIIKKIDELVGAGVTEVSEVKKSLKLYM